MAVVRRILAFGLASFMAKATTQSYTTIHTDSYCGVDRKHLQNQPSVAECAAAVSADQACSAIMSYGFTSCQCVLLGKTCGLTAFRGMNVYEVVQATPTPTPSPSPITTTLAGTVVANIQVDTPIGSPSLILDDINDFAEGQTLEIDAGTPEFETSVVKSLETTAAGRLLGTYGKLHLVSKTTKLHNRNSVVKGLPTGTTTPGITATTTPVVVRKDAVAEVQQQVAGVPNPLLMIGLFVSAAIIALVFRAVRKHRQTQQFQGVDASDFDVAATLIE